jgi:hypothetical protein
VTKIPAVSIVYPIQVQPVEVSCSPPGSSAPLDQPVIWNATAVGGTGVGYTYSWSGTDGLSGSDNPLSKTYSTIGTKKATVIATDSAGNSGTSEICTVNVTYPSLTATCKALPSVPQLNQSVTWSVVSVTGGAGGGNLANYTYQWQDACTKSYSQSTTCNVAGGYATTGAKTATLTARDAAGNTGQAQCTANVNPLAPCP